MTEDQSIRLVCFIEDLFLASKIESAARGLEYEIEWVGKASDISPISALIQGAPLAEHLDGPGAVLIERISSWRPALIIFDLANASVPWQSWLPLLKSSPATRRYPVVCYGSHVEAQTLKEAEGRGADAVYPRSRFFADVSGMLLKHARLIDQEALQSACLEPISEKAIHGMEFFNRGEFFEAHELLEEAWNEETSLGRELYRAILQVAVAYLQVERGNYNGALKMFLRLRQWIEPLPDSCRGVDIAGLRHDAHSVYQSLLELGRERIAEFDPSLLKPVRYHLN